MPEKEETIAAISTAMNNSGIGIVRVSGPEAFEIVDRIFKPAREKNIKDVPGYSIHYGHIFQDREIIDEVLVMIMKAPHTYTREDTVEINCHGGTYVIKRVLEAVLKSGARIAEPGEFTKRAFLNGRIDLSQAEAVIDIINAENNYALKSSVSQLKGSVSNIIREKRAVLLEQTAYIEAALDDPEHIEMDDYDQILLPILKQLADEIDVLVKTYEDGKVFKEGIKTVILGKPNVGKSSLLNAILGVERAIVTDIAGTTRDAIEECARIGDISLNIIDTAGIRETDDLIEQIGVNKAREYAATADLVIIVLDGSNPLDENDENIFKVAEGKKTIVLLNKKDLGLTISANSISDKYGVKVVEASVACNQGISEMTDVIKEMFFNGDIDFNDQVFITNERQKESLVRAENSLKNAIISIENGMPEDFWTIDMMAAYENLGNVIGESIEDDLADEIFAKFCMGK